MFVRVLVLVAFGLANIALFVRMVWGPTGILQYRDLKAQHTALQAEIAEIDARNLALSREIRMMQTDHQYMEKMVRKYLNFVRDKEVLYLFEDPASGRKGVAAGERKN